MMPKAEWWEDLTGETRQTVRIRVEVTAWPCECGREFTTAGGRTTHRKKCEPHRAMIAALSGAMWARIVIARIAREAWADTA